MPKLDTLSKEREQRVIFCSYKDFYFVKDRYPKRKVYPHYHVMNGWFFWLRRNGAIITMRLTDFSTCIMKWELSECYEENVVRK